MVIGEKKEGNGSNVRSDGQSHCLGWSGKALLQVGQELRVHKGHKGVDLYEAHSSNSWESVGYSNQKATRARPTFREDFFNCLTEK